MILKGIERKQKCLPVLENPAQLEIPGGVTKQRIIKKNSTDTYQEAT